MDREPKNIIVKMPNWLGDCVMATPVLQDLKSHFPKARITVMIASHLAQLLAGNPYIDEMFCYAKTEKTISARLRKGNFDVGILLTNSFSSAWWFFRGGVKKRIGFANELRSVLLRPALPFPKEREKQHLVMTYKSLLTPLNIPLSATAPQLFVSGAEDAEARLLLENLKILRTKRVIGMNPGAAFGPAKCWLPERFKAVAKRLLEKGDTYILFFGDQATRPLVEEICEGLPLGAINLCGKTSMRQLIALIKICDVFLTNDSGPMHIAAALKTPMVALFGSTSDVTTGPYNHGKVIHKHVSCSPCYLRTCPIDFKCMKRIAVDEVMEAIDRELI